MIFAAGLGTRLRPLTDNLPKALVPVMGEPLLAHLLKKFQSENVNEIIINTHHMADQVEAYLASSPFPSLDITISKEDQLLDTGGGLKKARWFFDEDEPFIVHNVDILSDINLSYLYEQHLQGQSLTTLAVKQRETTRYLLFDDKGTLVGREADNKIIPAIENIDVNNIQRLSFLGIHVISPALFRFFPEEEVFSILDCYLNAARAGEKIGFSIPDYKYWFDLGKKETLIAAEEAIGSSQ